MTTIIAKPNNRPPFCRSRVCARCGEIIRYPLGKYVSRGKKVCVKCRRPHIFQARWSKPLKQLIKEWEREADQD